jgi:Flp pilus assembly protein TadB
VLLSAVSLLVLGDYIMYRMVNFKF